MESATTYPLRRRTPRARVGEREAFVHRSGAGRLVIPLLRALPFRIGPLQPFEQLELFGRRQSGKAASKSYSMGRGIIRIETL